MGGKKSQKKGKKIMQQQQPNTTQEDRNDNKKDPADDGNCGGKPEELQNTLGDFTDKGNWNKFFQIRGSSNSFEWYAEWPQLKTLLPAQLSFQSKEQLDSAGAPEVPKAEVNILVPGCGNSKMSEHLYDAGFKSITNIDFSNVVISDMLKRNVRSRSEMKWRVMDMTKMQFANATFDAIVDKGGLDALMEPKHGPKLGYLYLSEVKRILKAGGKFICLTLAEHNILDLLLPMFRFGWKMTLHALETSSDLQSSSNLQSSSDLQPSSNLQTFMVVAEKDSSTAVFDISFEKDKSDGPHGKQVPNLLEALVKEKKIRKKYSNGSDIVYSAEDLHLGAKGDISIFEPGRRINVILGEPKRSRFIYNGILLDSKEEGPFVYHYGAFIVPQHQAHDWLYTTQEGQRFLLASSNVARLLMIILDSSNTNVDMHYIQMDLSPLVKELAPRHCDDSVQIPFLAAGDGIADRKTMHKGTSVVTGPILVEDVVYPDIDDDDVISGRTYRRLTFQRTENLVQSEALLKASESVSPAPKGVLKIDHKHLASSYHAGIISGILMISPHLKDAASDQDRKKAAVIGLGAGLLPMFMKLILPSLMIEVVELDPMVLKVARDYFDFTKEDDDLLKVHIMDGVEFVNKSAFTEADGKFDVLIVDVDSADTSSGLTCPAADFVDESFLMAVKYSLAETGLFIINLVSRSPALKHEIKLKIQKVFKNVLTLQLEKDVNEVIFAMMTPITEDQLSVAREKSENSLQILDEDWKAKVWNLTKSINFMGPLRVSNDAHL